MSFDAAVSLVLKHEGGYVNNPADPGGETNFGISKRAYPNEDIQHLTVDRAKAIYRRDYWDKAACEGLPEPLALIVFDCAVNAGVHNAVRWLQETLGVTVDGVVGPQTIAAAQQVNSRTATIRLTRRRILYYASLPTFDTFGPGWVQRSLETLLVAVA